LGSLLTILEINCQCDWTASTGWTPFDRNENELKLIMGFRILQEDGVSCRSLKCDDLEQLANIIRSQPKEVKAETMTREEK
jgi:hypothetical protein